MMSGSGTSFFCLGKPNDSEHFLGTFPRENDVQIFEAFFQSRCSPDGWYLEQLPST